MNFEQHICEVPNFPKEGILFYDITPLLATPEVYQKAIDAIAQEVAKTSPDVLIAPEARGFFFGVPVALKLGIPFVPVRKKGKLPRKTLEIDSSLEYGTATLCIHEDAIKPNKKVAIVDDILATGGTAKAMCDLVESQNAKIACCAFFMELDFLKGRELINRPNTISILRK